jgi:hypothetical protein
MQPLSSVRGHAGYVVTEQGKLDLRCVPTCECNPRLVGLLLECPDCGTVYGSLRDGHFDTGGSLRDRKR